MPSLWVRGALRTIQGWDRLRLRLRAFRHPGLEVHPEASSNFASARFELEPGARLRIGPGAVTERRREGVRFHLGPGAEMEIGAGAWLRSDVQPVHLVAFRGGRIRVGPHAFLNGCHVSAKRSVELGERAWVGTGSRIFDADQHALDADTPERVAPVVVEAFAWIASDTTVLRGVRVGTHAVVGTRSLVTEDVPPHTLAYGIPARPHGKVGDRSSTP